MIHQCYMCRYSANSYKNFLRHLVRRHRNDPWFNVTCNVDGCGASYKKWNSFRVHVRRKHIIDIGRIEHNTIDHCESPNEAELVGGVELEEQNEITDVMREIRERDDKFLAAKLMLDARESCRISHTALKSLVSPLQCFFSDTLESLWYKLKPHFAKEGLTGWARHKFEEAMKTMDAMDYFNNQSNLEKYFIRSCGLVAPKEVLIHENWKWVAGYQEPQLKKVKTTCYIIPFLESLTNLLNNKQILEFVLTSKLYKSSELGTYVNYNDGEYIKNLEIFQSETIALQLILYYDDVELVNPLGSNITKHKVSMFYWSLGNLPPHLRSSLKAINLVGIIKTKIFRKWGPSYILKDFLSIVKRLESPGGIDFHLCGKRYNFRGFLMIVCADTLASNYLGGFKESVGCTHMPCRTCNVRRENICKQFLESQFIMRDKETHMQQCLDIETPGLSIVAKKFWCQLYGIRERSILCDLQYFDVTKCMLHDFMHVVLEGVLELVIRVMLKRFIVEEGFLSCEDLNFAMNVFSYKTFKINKPSPIEITHLHTRLKQSASKMISLAYTLPFLLYGKVPTCDNHLLLFTKFLQIVNVFMAFKISSDTIDELKMLVQEHHVGFRNMYPNVNMTPKCHYFLHLASQIQNFGPLRHHWCMRYEAFHMQFKEISRVIRNFKNIPLSLCYRFQMKRLSQMSCNDYNSIFLSAGDSVKEGKTILVSDFKHGNILMETIPECRIDDKVMVSNQVVHCNMRYTCGNAILLFEVHDRLPEFGSICHVIVYKRETYLLVAKFSTLTFEETLNAYKISLKLPHEYFILSVKHILHNQELPIFYINSDCYTILLFYGRIDTV